MNLREEFITTAQTQTGTLSTSCFDMAGKDYVGMYFAGLYDPLAQDVAEAMGALARSLGGVPEGLIATANAYLTADAASTPGGASSVQTYPVPSYGVTLFERPTESSDHGYLDIETVSRNPAWVALKQLGDPLQLLMDFFPRGHQDRLSSASAAWKAVSASVNELSQSLDTVLDTLTINDNADKVPRQGPFPGRLAGRGAVTSWRAAMVTYCGRIWGSAEFGASGLPARPLGLIGRCADELAKLCDEQIDAINTTRSLIERRLLDAGAALIFGAILAEETGGVALELAADLAEGLLEDCVKDLIQHYYSPIERVKDAWDSLNLRDSLQKAIQDAPTMQATEARSESIGDRALHDFSYVGETAKTPKYFPGPNPKNNVSTKPYSGRPGQSSGVMYPIDLAGEEGFAGAHTIDLHVGQTDAQLQQRLAIQTSNKDGSSSFSSLASAQTLMQEDLNDNQADITAWLDGIKNGTISPKQGKAVRISLGPGVVTGRTVDMANNSVVNAHGVEARLKYNASLSPPFYVTTSFPIA